MGEVASPGASNDGGETRTLLPDGWKGRIAIPSLLAGVLGGGFGLAMKRRQLATSYAANLAIVTGCYCVGRELARDARPSQPDDLLNSVIGGVASGAVLGRIQGGHLGAVRYAIIFSAAGTAFDFAAQQMWPHLVIFSKAVQSKGSISTWSFPEWSPIQALDEKALAAKRAREEQLLRQRIMQKLNKDES